MVGFPTVSWMDSTASRLFGGLPIIPKAANQAVGRSLFLMGAVLCGAMAVYAFRDGWRLLRRPKAGF